MSFLNKDKQNNVRVSLTQETVNELINLYNQGQLSSVVKQAQALIEQHPQAFILWNILGAANLGLGQVEQALENLKKVTELHPHYADGFNNLGAALKDQGELEKAIEAYKKAISIEPNYPEAFNNMGNVLKDQGKLDEAIESYNKALSINPDYAEAYNNMGNALKDQGEIDEAIEAYNKALTLKPDYAEAYNNIGNSLKNQGKLDEAIEAYNKALSIKPDYEATRAEKLYQQAHVCDWKSIEEERKLIPELGTTKNSINPFSMLSLEDAPERHYLRSKVYAEAQYPQKPIPLPAKPSKRPECIRIGYFSTDFKRHPVAYLIAKVIEQHNRDKFQIFGYSLMNNKEDELQQRLTKSFDIFKDVSAISDKEVALLSRQDNIDIAIDLNGYTQNSRSGIFAYRAAPIQINYLGYPSTMGIKFIDYIIADQNLIPLESQKFFSEKPIYLPNTYMPTDNTRKFSQYPISRNEIGLPNDGFVFCCFNNNYKMTSAEFNIWMRLLHKIKGSVLWLRRSNMMSDKNIIKEAQKRNVDPSRIIFADKVPMDEHLARLKLADLFIDTFSFNGHTTTTEALWAGLPVVTKQGKGFASRVAASLIKAIGLPELITNSEKDYEALILDLATNPNKINKVKNKLVSNIISQPLFDTEKYTKHLENGYQKVYQNYFQEQPPQTIFIPK